VQIVDGKVIERPFWARARSSWNWLRTIRRGHQSDRFL